MKTYQFSFIYVHQLMSYVDDQYIRWCGERRLWSCLFCCIRSLTRFLMVLSTSCFPFDGVVDQLFFFWWCCWPVVFLYQNCCKQYVYFEELLCFVLKAFSFKLLLFWETSIFSELFFLVVHHFIVQLLLCCLNYLVECSYALVKCI